MNLLKIKALYYTIWPLWKNATAEQINGILNEFGLKTIKSIQIAKADQRAVEILLITKGLIEV
jgi:hypothetical protein